MTCIFVINLFKVCKAFLISDKYIVLNQLHCWLAQQIVLIQSEERYYLSNKTLRNKSRFFFVYYFVFVMITAKKPDYACKKKLFASQKRDTKWNAQSSLCNFMIKFSSNLVSFNSNRVVVFAFMNWKKRMVVWANVLYATVSWRWETIFIIYIKRWFS